MSATTFPVTVHEYFPTPTGKKLNWAYEYGIHDSAGNNDNAAAAALVFIGGLGDGPHGVPYIRTIAKALSEHNLNHYSVFEMRLSSAFSGWGYSSLAQDVDEIAGFVRYLREKKKRVVLMGHSTGCQDCMAYLRRLAAGGGDKIPEVDGVILQGPVSDREAIGMSMDGGDMEDSREWARGRVEEGRKDDFMPREKLPEDMRDSPVTVYRWFSLTSNGGDDDFFSSDMSDGQLEGIWKDLKKPVLVLPSARDEYVPASIDVVELMGRWKKSCRPGVYSDLSAVIPDANHRVDNPDSQDWMADRVVRFLSQVQSGITII